jgi:transposase InsO family protein
MLNGTQPPRRMRFSFESRCRLAALVLAGESPPAAAAACGASRATGYRLWRRYQEGGWAALADRPPVPRQQPRRLSGAGAADPGGARVRESGAADRRSPARPAGLDRLEGAAPPRRLPPAPGRASSCTSTSRSLAASGRSASASAATGSFRSRRAGWQHLHLAIDDHSRLAYAELLPSESPADCVAFLRRAVDWYRERGISLARVLSDNGNGYHSHAWASASAELGVARRYTRPRRQQTNGKADALVKTLVREWAYRFAYPTSGHRARALFGYLRWYNRHRPHSSLGGRPPISRVSQVCGSHN